MGEPARQLSKGLRAMIPIGPIAISATQAGRLAEKNCASETRRAVFPARAVTARSCAKATDEWPKMELRGVER